jgi:hypothetical protein
MTGWAPPRPRHPRAGIALGLAILAVWLGGFSVALVTGEPGDERRGSQSAPVTASR